MQDQSVAKSTCEFKVQLNSYLFMNRSYRDFHVWYSFLFHMKFIIIFIMFLSKWETVGWAIKGIIIITIIHIIIIFKPFLALVLLIFLNFNKTKNLFCFSITFCVCWIELNWIWFPFSIPFQPSDTRSRNSNYIFKVIR